MLFHQYATLFAIFTVTFSFSVISGVKPKKNEVDSENFIEEKIAHRQKFIKFISSHLSSLFLEIQNGDIKNPLFQSVSESCMNHSIEVIQQIGNFENIPKAETWALQMFDAWGKFPEGILSGHIHALGDFDECLGIRWSDANKQTVQGKYCYNYLIPDLNADRDDSESPSSSRKYSHPTASNYKAAGSLEDILAMIKQSQVTDYPLFPSFGSCFPSSCSDLDINQLLSNALELSTLNGTLTALTINCETEGKRQFTKGDYTMISVLSVLGAAVLIGTAVDSILANKQKNSRIWLQAVVSFSLYTNIRKWWNTEQKSSDGLGCLHGIKFFSTCWVILGHTFLLHTNQPMWNTLEMYKVHEKSALLLVILNAGVVVETFFTVGGFLVSYTLLKTLDKCKGKLNVPLLYLNRYIRLTPSYALILGFCTTLITHLSSGPSWYIMDILAGFCKKHWWKNLLYINAITPYYPSEDPLDLPCHGQSWYLSADMMFFLISPFFIYPLWRKPKFGVPLMTFATFSSVVIPCVITYTDDFKPVSILFADTKGGRFSRDAYMAPWMRAAPYTVGMWLGFLLYKKPKFLKISKKIIIGGWLIATATALTVLLGIHHYFDPFYDIPKVEGAIYSGVHRLVWALSIAWLIFACSQGYGGYVNKFLCWKGFIPLSRLGYCAFLVSLQLQFLFHLRYRQSINYDFYSAINIFFSHMVTSYSVAFVCSMTMEAPFMQLEKISFGKQNENPVQNKKLDDASDKS